jgi:hypothetical protein
VQIYGAQGISEGLEEAVSRARQGLVAVRAVLANFEQSQMSPVGLALGETLREAFLAPLAIVVIGHPDALWECPWEGAPEEE